MRGSYLSTQVWRNAATAMAALACSMAGQAVLFTVLARTFGPAHYGIVTFAFTILYVAGGVAALGSDVYATRRIAAGAEFTRPIPALLLTFQLLNACIVLGVILATLPLWSHSSLERLFVAILALSLVPETVVSVTGASFYGRERFLPFAAILASSSAAVVVVVWPAAALGASLPQVGLLLVLVKTLTALLAARVHACLIGPLGLCRPAEAYRALAAGSLPYFVIAVLAALHMKIDIPLVRAFCGNVELGLYGFAAMAVYAAAALIQPLSVSLFPAVAREGGRASELCSSRALRTLAVPLAAGTLVAFAVFLLAPPLIRVLPGPAYAGAVPSLRILACCLPMIFVSSTALRVLMASGHTRTVTRILAANCAVNIATNLALLPRFGIRGAALATVLSSAVSALQAVIFLARRSASTAGASKPGGTP